MNSRKLKCCYDTKNDEKLNQQLRMRLVLLNAHTVVLFGKYYNENYDDYFHESAQIHLVQN